jgi:predicted AAA+ superfamily ATPase
VERFDIKGKRILEGERKYYLNDLAFRNFLFSSFDEGIGGHLENLIFLHFKACGWKVYVGKIKKLEVDFVLEKNEKKQYIQVAHSLNNKKVIEREFGSLEEIDNSYSKTVITMDDVSFGNKEGIEHKLIWEVLG